MNDNELFAPDLPGNRQIRDPLGGADPEALLRRIIAKPERLPRRDLLDQILDRLAVAKALKEGTDVETAKRWLLARHERLRRAMVQGGLADRLEDPDQVELATSFAAAPAGLDASAAGELIDRRCQHLVADGMSYADAMRAVCRADPGLADAYHRHLAEPVALPTAGDAFDALVQRRAAERGIDYAEALEAAKIEFPALAKAYAAGESWPDEADLNSPTTAMRQAREARERRIGRRIDPATMIKGRPYLAKLGPIAAGGGLFEVEG